MVRRTSRVFLLLVCLAILASLLPAQNQKQITIRMIDGKTGLLIATSNFLVRVNHLKEDHGDWVQENEDGTGALTLPADAQEISIHGTYESATLVYVNCDSDKDRGSADHAPSPTHWYSVASILATGVVAPNNCVGSKVPERLQVIAKPGEFVFFVRALNGREQLKE